MKCLKCGLENPDHAKLCNQCGNELETVCWKCGRANPPGSKFCNQCGQRLDEVVEAEEAGPAFQAERKHVTVLFSDLSGYTAMYERLDPEEVKEIMSRIFEEITQVVTNYEGFIEKFVGDAVMAIFGVPKAQEDDPVRAIRAAREIHELVEAMSPQLKDRIGRSLSMHTGIYTGLVVTGEVDLEKGTHGVLGDTINVASRLSNLARLGEILVGPDTYVQAEGYFNFDRLEPTKVKGKAEPIEIYKVLSPRERPSKIHRLHGLRADLIGRKVEMAQLGEAVERLSQGESTILSISGDAGTGKSRLVEEFKATLNFEAIQWREGHAYAFAQNIPFFPMIDMMNRAWEIEEGDPPETVKEKVESNIEHLVGRKDDVAPYVGSLYALSYPEIEGVDPEFWRNQLYKAIQKILSALAQRAPTVICLEDLHWADPSSLDLLRFILSEFSYPALFLFVYRPYFSLFAIDQPSTLAKSLQEIRIGDLSPSEAQGMTASLLKTETIPAELQSFVQERVEGNPFYLEEVINSLIETETLIRDNGNWKLTRSISESGISPTIHGVISGRVDRLEKETKRILQEASVIGRVFLYKILKRITELKENIDQRLKGLEGLDLIRTKTLQPELEYIFKHALTQEVVYEGLLKKERQEIHERIGLVMEELFRGRLSEFYESLAFHFKQGQSILKAVDYLMKSGEKALTRYAVEESHQYYKEGFDLLANKKDKSREEKGLFIDLINEWASVEHCRGNAKAMYELLKAHESLAESLGDKSRLGRFYVWLGSALWYRGKHKGGYQYLNRALKLGEETDNQWIVCYACAWLTHVCAELGLLEEANTFGERAEGIARLLPFDPHPVSTTPFASMGYLHWFKGDTKKVFEYGKKLLDYGEKHSDIRSLVWGGMITGIAHQAHGNLQASVKCFKDAVQISRDPFFLEHLSLCLGAAYLYRGQFQEAEEALEQPVTFFQKFDCGEMDIVGKLYLGAALIGKGHMGRGLEMIEEAQWVFLENERKSFYAISEYILGKIYLQIAERAAPMTLSTIAKNIGFLVKNVPFAGKKAESHFNKAIELAKEIGAKAVQAQALLDLGLLHKAKGRMGRAREHISKSIELFEEGGAEGFLKQAKEALASLG